MRRFSLLSTILALIVLPAAATAQRGDGLEARHRAFLRALLHGGRDSVVAFFPRRGDWTQVEVMLEAQPGHQLSVRRFSAAQTRAMIGEGGPACWSFQRAPGGGSSPEPTFLAMRADYAEYERRRWRRVRGNRFVPPGRPAASSTFVEWRREDGRWVVSAYGDESPSGGPHLAGTPAEIVRDRDTVTLLPPTPVYAGGERWYDNSEPFMFGGERYVKYGQPRPLEPGLLRRIGRRGRMAVYAEREVPEPGPDGYFEVLYVPSAPGEYQPYTIGEAPLSCGFEPFGPEGAE
jgi:hypothetical protein